MGLLPKILFVYSCGNPAAFREIRKFLNPAIYKVILQIPYDTVRRLQQPQINWLSLTMVP